jgi:hypothetical protein
MPDDDDDEDEEQLSEEDDADSGVGNVMGSGTGTGIGVGMHGFNGAFNGFNSLNGLSGIASGGGSALESLGNGLGGMSMGMNMNMGMNMGMGMSLGMGMGGIPAMSTFNLGGLGPSNPNGATNVSAVLGAVSHGGAGVHGGVSLDNGFYVDDESLLENAHADIMDLECWGAAAAAATAAASGFKNGMCICAFFCSSSLRLELMDNAFVLSVTSTISKHHGHLFQPYPMVLLYAYLFTNVSRLSMDSPPPCRVLCLAVKTS